ncbi:sulfate permease [Aaosphaeria arxii CBS 175.79]|uniref:Sulfate permease n=1 Tax=Aaosphaeria arxii CBS 175.79 TaxID=1450172 RepID=A0A6A5XAX2_9PLEO|nr:sulfate permease [Aaosphaeria arxii CBS 175.79]KAF2010091.1 sulfate permease [Aaosphaeria arxii CBS 175.79]
MGYWNKARTAFAEDQNTQRFRYYGGRAARALPSASLNYLVEKVPVIFWLPKYNPRWLLNDALAGITIGVLLIPQSLAYAKIATIPGQHGLFSSWLPNFLYFFMGTSKDMSTGPTSLIGLLTAEIIRDIASEGFAPEAIASAVAMSMGIYCLIVGLFKLGFLLEFVSIPVLHGFISAAGIVIMLGQIPSLFGVKVGTGTAKIIHDLFAQIPDFKGPTVGVGLGGILLLVLMQKMGQRWGKKNKIIWFVALARSAIVLILFTGISYGINKNRDDDPVWELSKVKSSGIVHPAMPQPILIQKVFARSVAPFLAAAIEHLAIAKGFARKNDYVIDPAQELVYLGFANFFNSFFSSMGVGGAMSRTAVNSDTGVKSPMYGFIAGGFVILAIYELTPALYWIPKATLAAIIVTAVWHVVLPPRVFYGYWKTSLVDFIASMLAFWVTLFVSTEIGIASAVGFNLAFHILYTAFQHITHVTTVEDNNQVVEKYPIKSIPLDTQVFQPSQSVIFSNAFRLKSRCFDVVQTYNSGSVVSLELQQANRNWSVSGERRVRQLRAKVGIVDEPHQISFVVLDFAKVATIDTTALIALQDLSIDLAKYGGKDLELRFVNLNTQVRLRFERFGWVLYDSASVTTSTRGSLKANVVYTSLTEALLDRTEGSDSLEIGPTEIKEVGSEKV